MSNNDIEWLEFAKTLAMKAGEIMLEARENSTFVRDYKMDHELVTSTDIAVDQFICRGIIARYPSHAILSEESSPHMDLSALATDVPVWVIDPIDGTVNFAHGHHHVAVSIGLYIGDKRILGVVNAPFLGECFWALKGSGAFCNGKRLAVSGAQELRSALVATGFPYQKTALAPIVERVSRILHHCQDVRRNGSAALDLCWVAAGRLDVYFESVKPWDMAAGALIAEEAGATVGYYLPQTLVWPEVVNGEGLLVSTPDLYDDILALVNTTI
ncbi:inositol monophosphatase [Marinomonas sp. M1K-6]|uniref:Inositol-1-monophosphatase n=1 Tax=Marinomonas profundi TaxID=2726122 RepID=A0A847QYK8_9GAMM|nr:inositol monophosphatase family protein [Marinomonas profundi]NLQ18099.1 inositol monophosphatase [Marinomonas profundi]UDV04117.1 inositol monophosphatase [Marinomonas profundi]